jgi:hypothetical protein
MKPDPLTIMISCYGDSCDCVPDEVFDVVEVSLQKIPGGDNRGDWRDFRAELIAPIMAASGWRFCPCFPMRRTDQHARIFSLVHTNLANRLANRAMLEGAVA